MGRNFKNSFLCQIFTDFLPTWSWQRGWQFSTSDQVWSGSDPDWWLSEFSKLTWKAHLPLSKKSVPFKHQHIFFQFGQMMSGYDHYQHVEFRPDPIQNVYLPVSWSWTILTCETPFNGIFCQHFREYERYQCHLAVISSSHNGLSCGRVWSRSGSGSGQFHGHDIFSLQVNGTLFLPYKRRNCLDTGFFHTAGVPRQSLRTDEVLGSKVKY